jgi:hypothetical protein
MAKSISTPKASSAKVAQQLPYMLHVFSRPTRPIRTVAKALIFFLKVEGQKCI